MKTDYCLLMNETALYHTFPIKNSHRISGEHEHGVCT